VAVKTADCVPILLADSVNRVVAAVHAGWRGTVQEIVRLTIERMEDRFGTKPEDIVAEVGPSIGPCCFEVGPEVARQFSKWNSALANRNRKEHLDLGDINCAQLCKAGVPAQHIRQIGLCTMCEPKLFHSYRRDREAAGRMMSWIRVV
jgi:YfiH family protein